MSVMGAPGVLAYNKALYRDSQFDPDRTLEPVALYARIPNVLVVNASVPARDVTELIGYANAGCLLGILHAKARRGLKKTARK